jgi:hypothetical protein
MPTGENVLGFQNKWYPEGYKNSIVVDIGEQYSIRIFSLPYFIASKLDAFTDRGKNDGRTSTDFEDIVYVMENSLTIWSQLASAPREVKNYLKNEFGLLMTDPYFFDWVNGHISYGSRAATYEIIQELKSFSET